MGASGVNVGGTFYDVLFQDGTCIALFNGCDDPSDFLFQNITTADYASDALLSHVFLDTGIGSFDTQPLLTNGVSNFIDGIALTPYEAVTSLGEVLAAGAYNHTVESGDTFNWHTSWNIFNDMSTRHVYAVWSPSPSSVPEPSTYLLLGSGLLGMAFYRRKQEQA